PSFPYAPQTQRILLVTMAFGLFLGVGLALFLEYIDQSVNTPSDVWYAAALPTLGVVPNLQSLRHQAYSYGGLLERSPLRRLENLTGKRRNLFSQELVISHPSFSILAESYHTLRFALLFTHKENPPRVILFTSAHPGDGKTLTTLNLATVLAQGGHKVMV